jgi:hypothetical protein
VATGGFPAGALVNLVAKVYNAMQLKESPPMQKRDKLEAMLRKISDEEFNTVWRETYDYAPEGDRADLVKDFVAEQYDGELDNDIKRVESFLTHVAKSKPNRWLVPR